jgi:hypothetical protein
MAFTVEDGTGIEGSNSYVSESEFDAYCEDRGLTPATGDVEPALVRATTALDGHYHTQYPGYRTYGREQGLEWPRTGAYDYEGNVIGDDEIPQEIKDATCEMCIRELTEPGVMTPDLGRPVQSIQAGSVGITYGGGTQMTTYTVIDGILSPILSGSGTSTYSGRAVRA